MDFEDYNDDDNITQLCDDHVTLAAFTAKWCGACKAFKPTLDDLVKNARKNDIHVKNYDSVKHKQFHDYMEIPYYPTILLYQPKKKTFYEYDEQDRTASRIVKFVKDNLSSNNKSKNKTLKIYKVID